MLRIVMVTAPSDKANALVRKLLSERLIACGNLIPGIRSLYWWKGKLEESDETLILMKCLSSGVSKLEKRIKTLHPYEVPEIVTLKAAQVNAPYLAWVREETRTRKNSSPQKKRTRASKAQKVF